MGGGEALGGTLASRQGWQKTAGAGAAAKMGAEARLFEEGALGSAPSTDVKAKKGDGGSGGAVGTYRELCAMATDLGQPELVYRSMDLAAHAKAATARAGAAFATASMAAAAQKALQPPAAALIPKLFPILHSSHPGPRVPGPPPRRAGPPGLSQPGAATL